MKELKQALASFEQSLRYQSALVEAHPSVTNFQEKLGRSHAEIADLLYRAGQRDEGLARIRQSIPILESLVRSDPDTASYHAALGRSLNSLGYFLDDHERKNDEALPLFENAVAQQRLALEGSRDETNYKRYLANALENLGEQFVDLGRVQEGIPHFQEAVEIRRQVLASHPESWDYTRELAHWYRNLGNIQRRAADPAGAIETFRKARAVWEPLAASHPEAQGRIAAIDTQIAAALADQKQSQEALKLLEPVVNRFKTAAESASFDTEQCTLYTDALWELMRVLRLLGRGADAHKIDVERAQLWKGRPPRDLAEHALAQTSGRVALIGYGKSPLGQPAALVRQLDLDQAAADLKLAIVLGFNDIASLRANRDAPLLLDRDDIQTMIRGLAHSESPPKHKP
jgi:tetratricopeptide (TPR) repeat protein